MARNKVEISGINTKDIIVLTNEEMQQLFIRKNEGDLYARDLLAQGNLKLVLSILRKFSNREENLDDLFQIGCIGLMKAIDNFDISYNVKFSTYAVPMIDGEIKRYLRDNSSSLRVSRSLKDIAYKSLKYQEDYQKEHGRIPDYEEVAKELGVTSFDGVLALGSLKEPISMYEVIYNDGGDAIYVCDQIEDKKSNGLDIDMKMAVNNAIDELEERERYVLDQRFVIGKTQTELANELGISQAQISRIEKRAIDFLKKTLK